MKIWLGSHHMPRFENGCALTIGNFDGVHLGHKHILQRLKAEADARGVPAVLLCFEPQPKEYFAHKLGVPDNSPRLTPLRDKLNLLKETRCLDAAFVLRFSASFASLSAEDFIEEVLLQSLNVKYLLVGDDFRFGAKRQGDVSLLQKQKAFVTEEMSTVLIQSSRASSTRVRELLHEGLLDEAQKLLGHNFCLSGKVKHGAKLARALGCPTANIHLPQHNYPLSGVFVVQVSGDFGSTDKKFGVASFGVNPTVSQTKAQKLEVHIFDFQGNLYGKRLNVSFLSKLRDEEKYSDIESLQAQIMLDMEHARNYLSRLNETD